MLFTSERGQLDPKFLFSLFSFNNDDDGCCEIVFFSDCSQRLQPDSPRRRHTLSVVVWAHLNLQRTNREHIDKHFFGVERGVGILHDCRQGSAAAGQRNEASNTMLIRCRHAFRLQRAATVRGGLPSLLSDFRVDSSRGVCGTSLIVDMVHMVGSGNLFAKKLALRIRVHPRHWQLSKATHILTHAHRAACFHSQAHPHTPGESGLGSRVVTGTTTYFLWDPRAAPNLQARKERRGLPCRNWNHWTHFLWDPRAAPTFLHTSRNATACNAARSTFHDHSCDGVGGAMVHEGDTARLYGYVSYQFLLPSTCASRYDRRAPGKGLSQGHELHGRPSAPRHAHPRQTSLFSFS